jgi:hypothetical protein
VCSIGVLGTTETTCFPTATSKTKPSTTYAGQIYPQLLLLLETIVHQEFPDVCMDTNLTLLAIDGALYNPMRT